MTSQRISRSGSDVDGRDGTTDLPTATNGPEIARPEIALSWQRSVTSGVVRTSADAHYVPCAAVPLRFLRAAQPVVDRLADKLQDHPVAIILADSDARVIARRTSQPKLATWLDRLMVSTGFSLAEAAVGTNAIGCALEERGPFVVDGTEHFREHLQEFSCCAVPVHNPVTGVINGVVGIGCRTAARCSLMLPLAQETAEQIESRLSENTSHSERVLLESFLKTTRRSSAAVVSLSRDFLVSNTVAGPLLSPADQPILWDWASRMLAACDEYTGELRLSDDVIVVARCTKVTDNRQTIG
ncbi:MAG: GAF domain-containing protein, partial [Pseudonocardiaceae bacterium]|nr:GAF domain-containing protein [Pseudonocardiaceae bacterium]